MQGNSSRLSLLAASAARIFLPLSELKSLSEPIFYGTIQDRSPTHLAACGLAMEKYPEMIPEQIEKIKSEFTDKYVAVSPDRPELARFKDHVGQVKTVNMSGRALVEFSDYHLNIGWYDIDLDYLKVVDKPKPKEKKPAAKKPVAKKTDAKPAARKPAASGEKKLSPLELARMQGAAKAGDGGATAAKPAAEKSTTSKNKEKKPVAADRSKMSVEIGRAHV